MQECYFVRQLLVVANLYEIVTLSDNYWLSLTYVRLLLCPTTIGCC